jgi:quercetin dioxygenase-like cupin family protein
MARGSFRVSDKSGRIFDTFEADQPFLEGPSMLKSSARPTWRLPPSLAAGLLLGLSLSFNAGIADTVPPTSRPADVHPELRTVLSTGTTVTGEPIQYPSGAPAQITAVEITLQPGQQTGWHTHPVPLLGYVLEGELTVDYGPKGERIYRKGEALAEAMNEAHNGRNAGQDPVKILAVFMGVEGTPGSVPASPPAR